MGKYDINFRRLIKQVLPIALRGNLVEFIYVLIAPIRDVYFRFMKAKQGNENKLSYNAQYPNLQRLLNDRFDATARRIKVKDSGESIDELLVFPNEAQKPIVINPPPPDEHVLIYPSSQWGYKPFLVLLHEDLRNVENRIRRLLDIYKFAGTKYTIEYN